MKSYVFKGLLAGAGILALAGRSEAAIIITESQVSPPTLFDGSGANGGVAPFGTYTEVDFTVTSLTGADAEQGSSSFSNDAGIIGLQGTFTAVPEPGVTGPAVIAVPGDNGDTFTNQSHHSTNQGLWTNFIYGNQAGAGFINSDYSGNFAYAASSVNLDGTPLNPTRAEITGIATGDSGAGKGHNDLASISGNSTSLFAGWSTNDSPVEVGQILAQIYVTPGDDVNFTGGITDFGSLTAMGTPGASPITFGAPLPEPGTLGVISVGLMGLLARRRRIARA